MNYYLAPFLSTFAPQGPATVDLLKLLLDTFAISYGVIGAAVWNKILKIAPVFKSKANDHSWAQDFPNSVVSNSVTPAKDTKSEVQGQVGTLNDISSELGKIAAKWANLTQQYMSNLFSDSDNALTQLDAFIDNGSWASYRI